MTLGSELPHLVDDITRSMTRKSAIRDTLIADGRQAIRHAANAVRALHRSEFDDAAELLERSGDLVADLVRSTTAHSDLYFAGYVQDAMKEFGEAAITAAVLTDHPIPSHVALGIEGTAWLNALAEAGSELRRDVLDALRGGKHDRAEVLLSTMDEMYLVLVTVDFPDALTGGLRRTTDQFRAVLERTRGDVTITTQQHRLQIALERLESRSPVMATPE